MTNSENFHRNTSIEEILKEIRQELLKVQRPADQIILDETDFCHFLKISKRHAANLRTTGAITYSKAGGRLYYLLSDIIDFIENNQIKKMDKSINIFKRKNK